MRFKFSGLFVETNEPNILHYAQPLPGILVSDLIHAYYKVLGFTSFAVPYSCLACCDFNRRKQIPCVVSDVFIGLALQPSAGHKIFLLAIR
jgi:hypothetical protein